MVNCYEEKKNDISKGASVALLLQLCRWNYAYFMGSSDIFSKYLFQYNEAQRNEKDRCAYRGTV